MRGLSTRPVVLIVAKAPVPGRVKTRLIGAFTPHEAAALAAAALLDTLDACRLAADRTDAEVVVALDGRLEDAVADATIAAALRDVRVIGQRGDGLGARLAHAHNDAAGPFGTTIQVGMDTPHVDPGVLVDAVATLRDADGADALLGPAHDGGWWALGLRRAGAARCLSGVPMSRADTGALTLAALSEECRRVGHLPALGDVDTVDDVVAVASAHANRFADLARTLLPRVEAHA